MFHSPETVEMVAEAPAPHQSRLPALSAPHSAPWPRRVFQREKAVAQLRRRNAAAGSHKRRSYHRACRTRRRSGPGHHPPVERLAGKLPPQSITPKQRVTKARRSALPDLGVGEFAKRRPRRYPIMSQFSIGRRLCCLPARAASAAPAQTDMLA